MQMSIQNPPFTKKKLFFLKKDVCDTVRHIANRQLENRAIKERKTVAKER